MAAYLIVDVDDSLRQFQQRGLSVDLQEMAVGLRGSAALAAGLIGPDKLKAVAVADWDRYEKPKSGLPADTRAIFQAAGYELFDMPHRDSLSDSLIVHYFSYEPEPVDEVILATTSADLIPLVERVRSTRNARIRVWGSENMLEDTPLGREVIFQPLDTLLGIQTKNVAVYIDFENIAISLTEQGYTVNLDHLIERFVMQAKAHGHVIKMAAYAPWGQRGSLPPLVDSSGREVADEAPSRLMLANIDPVFNLPGKNSADMRIAQDVTMGASYGDAADVYILASGDRDFNQVLNSLRSRNKTVIVWGVHGSTSRQIENNPGIQLEYIEDFTDLQTHQSWSAMSSAVTYEDVSAFTPSQWSSVIIQMDRLAVERGTNSIPSNILVQQLEQVNAVISQARGEDLVLQAMSLGILKAQPGSQGNVRLDDSHPVVEKTRLIVARVVLRVQRTLQVRDWEYVNYGFLLKGLAMDRDLDQPGCNLNDQWRSDWIDCLVREQILIRELIPHRHNPDDLVPVIRTNTEFSLPDMQVSPSAEAEERDWAGVGLDSLDDIEPATANMIRRIVVSVEQFTSFRGFSWCPLGSLHKRLSDFDSGTAFQRAVEYLIANEAAEVAEYPNPQSDFYTKGISLKLASPITQQILDSRDSFVRLLLSLYEHNKIISENNLRQLEWDREWDLDLWFSVMESENVLNRVPGRSGQYSLFRTHHTVNLVAESRREGQK